jgi:hypothetical protein
MLAMTLLPGIAYAQGGTTIKAEVPFNFTVGDKTIPAGTCLVRVEGMTGGALSIRNPDAKAATYAIPLPTQSANPSERTVLVFHRYGDRYFLASIQRSGSSSGYKLQETRVEKELRAQNRVEHEEIRLAAK